MRPWILWCITSASLHTYPLQESTSCGVCVSISVVMLRAARGDDLRDPVPSDGMLRPLDPASDLPHPEHLGRPLILWCIRLHPCGTYPLQESPSCSVSVPIT